MFGLILLSVLAAVSLGDLVSLLIALLIIGIIIYVVIYVVILIVGMLPIPPNLKTIVYLIVAVIAPIAILEVVLQGTVGLR